MILSLNFICYSIFGSWKNVADILVADLKMAEFFKNRRFWFAINMYLHNNDMGHFTIFIQTLRSQITAATIKFAFYGQQKSM